MAKSQAYKKYISKFNNIGKSMKSYNKFSVSEKEKNIITDLNNILTKVDLEVDIIRLDGNEGDFNLVSDWEEE